MMDISSIVVVVKAVGQHDPWIALTMGAIFTFLAGLNLQKWIGSVATKDELKAHRSAVYMETLQVKDAVKENMAGFHERLNRHEEKDDTRFGALDDKQTGMFGEVFQRLNNQDKSLGRIEGKLQISAEGEATHGN